MTRRFIVVALVIVCSLTIMTASAFGQAVYGSILGTITDPSGAAVAGAKVTVTSVGKGTTAEATTNVDGNYTVTHLIPDVYNVKAEAPGFEAEDLEVSVSGNLLTIKADKKRETTEKKGDGSFEERHLERVVTLPAGADPDKVEAKYHNGILEVHLAKTEDAKRKRIPVKADSDTESTFKSPGRSGL